MELKKKGKTKQTQFLIKGKETGSFFTVKMRQRLVRTLRHECCVPICCRRDRGCRAFSFFPFRPPPRPARAARSSPSTATPRPAPSSCAPASAGSISCSARAAPWSIRSASAAPDASGRAGSMIDSKRIQPAWGPPPDIKREHPEMPDVIPGGSPRNPMGAAALTLVGRRIRHPRHQQSGLDRRLRLLRLHPDVQPGHHRSVRSRQRRHAGDRHPLKPKPVWMLRAPAVAVPP